MEQKQRYILQLSKERTLHALIIASIRFFPIISLPLLSCICCIFFTTKRETECVFVCVCPLEEGENERGWEVNVRIY